MMTLVTLATLLCVLMAPWVVHGFAPSSAASRTTTSQLWALSTADAPPSTANKMMEVQSHADWMELLFEDNEAAESSIKAVFFHASWCKFCQRFKLHWNRQRRIYGDTVTFASVEYSTNKKLCQSLDVEHLPTIQFYHQDSLLHSAPCSPKNICAVKQRLELYLTMDEDQLEEAAELWEQGVELAP